MSEPKLQYPFYLVSTDKHHYGCKTEKDALEIVYEPLRSEAQADHDTATLALEDACDKLYKKAKKLCFTDGESIDSLNVNEIFGNLELEYMKTEDDLMIVEYNGNNLADLYDIAQDGYTNRFDYAFIEDESDWLDWNRKYKENSDNIIWQE